MIDLRNDPRYVALEDRIDRARADMERGELDRARAMLDTVIEEAGVASLRDIAARAVHARAMVAYLEPDRATAIVDAWHAYLTSGEAEIRDRAILDLGRWMLEAGRFAAAWAAFSLAAMRGSQDVVRGAARIGRMHCAALMRRRRLFERCRAAVRGRSLSPALRASYYYACGEAYLAYGRTTSAVRAFRRSQRTAREGQLDVEHELATVALEELATSRTVQRPAAKRQTKRARAIETPKLEPGADAVARVATATQAMWDATSILHTAGRRRSTAFGVASRPLDPRQVRHMRDVWRAAEAAASTAEPMARRPTLQLALEALHAALHAATRLGDAGPALGAFAEALGQMREPRAVARWWSGVWTAAETQNDLRTAAWAAERHAVALRAMIDHPDVVSAFRRAHTLAQAADDVGIAIAAQRGEAVALLDAGQYAAALRTLDEIILTAQSAGRSDLVAAAVTDRARVALSSAYGDRDAPGAHAAMTTAIGALMLALGDMEETPAADRDATRAAGLEIIARVGLYLGVPRLTELACELVVATTRDLDARTSAACVLLALAGDRGDATGFDRWHERLEREALTPAWRTLALRTTGDALRQLGRANDAAAVAVVADALALTAPRMSRTNPHVSLLADVTATAAGRSVQSVSPAVAAELLSVTHQLENYVEATRGESVALRAGRAVLAAWMDTGSTQATRDAGVIDGLRRRVIYDDLAPAVRRAWDHMIDALVATRTQRISMSAFYQTLRDFGDALYGEEAISDGVAWSNAVARAAAAHDEPELEARALLDAHLGYVMAKRDGEAPAALEAARAIGETRAIRSVQLAVRARLGQLERMKGNLAIASSLLDEVIADAETAECWDVVANALLDRVTVWGQMAQGEKNAAQRSAYALRALDASSRVLDLRPFPLPARHRTTLLNHMAAILTELEDYEGGERANRLLYAVTARPILRQAAAANLLELSVRRPDVPDAMTFTYWRRILEHEQLLPYMHVEVLLITGQALWCLGDLRGAHEALRGGLVLATHYRFHFHQARFEQVLAHMARNETAVVWRETDVPLDALTRAPVRAVAARLDRLEAELLEMAGAGTST